MTDIDSGSRGKVGEKKWLKMGISNAGFSNFARIVHRGEGRRIEDTRIEACVYTIFFNLGRRGRSIDVALIHDGALDRERNVLPPFHPDIHPRSDFHSRLRRKREKRTQSRLKNG